MNHSLPSPWENSREWHIWRAGLAYFGLLGSDGRPSFSKLTIWGVVVLSAASGTLNTAIVFAVIAGSLGRGPFLELVRHLKLGVSASDTQVHVLSEARVRELAVAAVKAEPNVWRDDER